MTTLTLAETGTTCVWCHGDSLDGNACPNDPTVCADCCPCHGYGVDYAPNVSVVTFGHLNIPLSTIRERVGDVPLTPHRVALALGSLLGITACDAVTLAVYDALRDETP